MWLCYVSVDFSQESAGGLSIFSLVLCVYFMYLCLFLFLGSVVSGVYVFPCFTIHCTQNIGEWITAIPGLWIDTIVWDESDGLPTDWFLSPNDFT